MAVILPSLPKARKTPRTISLPTHFTMRFLQTAFVAISLAVYPTVMAQQLQGQGSVQVISDDGITFRGCLDDVGAWSSNFCGGITIVGDGYLSTNHGYLTLTESLEITVTPDVADAAYWQATDYSSFVSG